MDTEACLFRAWFCDVEIHLGVLAIDDFRDALNLMTILLLEHNSSQDIDAAAMQNRDPYMT